MQPLPKHRYVASSSVPARSQNGGGKKGASNQELRAHLWLGYQGRLRSPRRASRPGAGSWMGRAILETRRWVVPQDNQSPGVPWVRSSGIRESHLNLCLAELSDHTGVRLTTETRVYATDPVAYRKFAVYWRVVRGGSALVRREWLKAIRRRAEAQ